MPATPHSLPGPNGQPRSGSIATSEQVTLNGSQQWITIRGKNAHNPVLLFLMGGPGAGGFPDQGFLARLEERFVVVNWDQPGTGKSYGAVPTAGADTRALCRRRACIDPVPARALPPGEDLCARLLVGQHPRDLARAAVS